MQNMLLGKSLLHKNEDSQACHLAKVAITIVFGGYFFVLCPKNTIFLSKLPILCCIFTGLMS